MHPHVKSALEQAGASHLTASAKFTAKDYEDLHQTAVWTNERTLSYFYQIAYDRGKRDSGFDRDKCINVILDMLKSNEYMGHTVAIEALERAMYAIKRIEL